MKNLLYTLIVSVIVSTVFLFISYNTKNKTLQLNPYKESTYCLNELCIDLKSLHYDFSVVKYSHRLFLSNNSKEIKIGNDSLYVYIYENNNLMEKDADDFVNYEEDFQCSLCSCDILSSLYKKDRLIVQYNGNDTNLKKSLESILGKTFLKTG